MEYKQYDYCDAQFQEELKSLKASVARMASLLEQALKNTSGKDPCNRLVNVVQT